MKLDCAGRPVDLTTPVVMGILNVTPDSFSDGGQFTSLAAALDRAGEMVDQGAVLIDVGGESTRPGAQSVSASEEVDRVIPVIESLAGEFSVPLSVDTSKPEVIKAAAAAGAGLINDVRALREPGALEAAAATSLPVCLMHMLGDPRSMQEQPHYDDVFAEVAGFFSRRIEACREAGIESQRIVVDPGFGFGKTLDHNLNLLAELDRFACFGVPVMVGFSRKSMFRMLLDLPVDERLNASVAAATLAMAKGARIIRAHDVRETVQAARLFAAVSESDDGGRGLL
jgi:dihydropteroate synthase